MGRKRCSRNFLGVLFAGMEILVGFIFDLWPVKHPKSLFMYSWSPAVFVWVMVQAFLPLALLLQLLYLLDSVQNGIRQPNLRFTFSLALYVARVAQQILKPGM